VLGTAGQNPAPYSGFAYEDLYPWEDDPIGLWRIGYTPTNWDAPPEARVVTTTHRHGNFDYATNTVHWAAGFDQTLPNSLYLAARPDYFGSLTWPWVTPTAAPRVFTLPARARYDAGNPNPFMLTVAKVGSGQGTVASAPAYINCGPVCTAGYTAGTIVNLTATPGPGSTFAGWSGACTGAGACQVTVNAATTVTATFALGTPYRYYPIAACRLVDTRGAAGPGGGPRLQANASRDFPAAGVCGIPADAKAVAVVLTALAATEAGNLRLYPAGAALPVASAINFRANRARANNGTFALGTSGQLSVRCDMAPGSTGGAHFVLDAFGYFK
ncbi:MAG TPA: hypothetical protein VF310_04730, partial [Vicinamibacteria bacterium]